MDLAANLPTFARLRREAATFERARSPGSQTAVSLSTLFSGRYFSELRWDKHGHGKSRFDYPASDPSPRLAHLLEGAGVRTTKVASLTFLRNEFGVAPGFGEELVVTEGRRHAHAQAVVQPLLERLRARPADQPAFFYAHLTEPHAPYDRGRLKTGPPFERYRSEVVEADAWLGRILRELASPALRGRAMLIVTADHGEAFGEHGSTEHTKTLYEELVRVPLFVWAPGVVARAVETPVGLVDLAPTILDVFGVDTPAAMKGQSLVPILRGGKSTLTRPLLAEGRLRRALWLGDRKVIVDTRRHVVEAFDLASDPGELVDRSGDPAFTEPLVATLNAFFAAHALTADGYTPPYKP
jgi:arylsulfatase A-like enzyme